MNIFELKESKCEKIKDLEVRTTKLRFTSNKAQECIFVWDIPNQKVLIRCSYRRMINKLAKNELFKLTKVLISTDMRARDKVLRIGGELPFKGFTIRKSFHTLSKDHKKQTVDKNPYFRSKKGKAEPNKGDSEHLNDKKVVRVGLGVKSE